MGQLLSNHLAAEDRRSRTLGRSSKFFDNVRVPVENRLGEEGQGWGVTISALASERSSIAEVHGPNLSISHDLTAGRDGQAA